MNSQKPLEASDAYDRQLEANVRPSDWSNPVPAARYNLVVVGAGTAGLVSAAAAAALGAKVALVEKARLGGDCLNVGCVPSKGLISAARRAADMRSAGAFGIDLPADVKVDFAAVMQRMRRIRAEISKNDSAQRFRELGVDVFLGHGQFSGPDRLSVGTSELRFKKAVIATGARAAAPPIQGLQKVEYLTNETIFSLTELPTRLAIIGAGPIGCELAQAFARFGSQVILVESKSGIMPREDRDAAAILRKVLVADGVEIICCGRDAVLSQTAEGIQLKLNSQGKEQSVVVDKLLVAVGRAPNVEGLELELANVDYDKHGVVVNDRLQTSNPRIYAAGDICSHYKFTHAADFMARIVIRNALFKGRSKASSLTIPWCTYTSPEIAQVGLTAHDAQQQGIEVDSFVQELADVDRAILDGEDEGFVKIHVKKGSDRILGASIVAHNAGDMISEITLAMSQKIGLGKIADSIHPYPTQAEAIRKLGDAYKRTKLTPFVASLFRRWLSMTR